MTPEERSRINERIARLAAELKASGKFVDADSIRAWLALYRERNALVSRLDEREAG